MKTSIVTQAVLCMFVVAFYMLNPVHAQTERDGFSLVCPETESEDTIIVLSPVSGHCPVRVNSARETREDEGQCTCECSTLAGSPVCENGSLADGIPKVDTACKNQDFEVTGRKLFDVSIREYKNCEESCPGICASASKVAQRYGPRITTAAFPCCEEQAVFSRACQEFPTSRAP